MIKALGSGPDGSNVLILSLSHANLDRLREGKPIKFDTAPYGAPDTIVIFAGETEQTMAAQLIETTPGLILSQDPQPE